jgi:hypothetical protein
LAPGTGGDAQSSGATWLDRPLSNWNDPVRGVPRATATAETIADLATRCTVLVRGRSAGEQALAAAGWLPYLHVDRQLAERDVEILGGMAAADGMCRPDQFNVFVFVGGRLAGTLSPTSMNSRNDGAIGAVRLAPDDTITADFARYLDRDALCCPSARVTVRYRVDRAGPEPVVVPVAVQARRP